MLHLPVQEARAGPHKANFGNNDSGEPPARTVGLAGYLASLRGSGRRVNKDKLLNFRSIASTCGASSFLYPFTLILENESTARPAVGCPMEVAGRNVVKMSMFFTCGGKSVDSWGVDKTR